MSKLPFELLLALRYLRPKRTFVSIITLISIVGVALGVAVLIIVISVMSGFDHDLREKILGFNAHIVVYNNRGNNHSTMLDYARIANIIASNKNVRSVSPVVMGKVLVETQPETNQQAAVDAPILRGVDPRTGGNMSVLPQSMLEGKFDLSGRGVVIGSEFARNLRLHVGDRLSIYSPHDIEQMHKNRGKENEEAILPEDYEVRGIYDVGYYEFNSLFIVTSLENAQDLYDLGDSVHDLEVMLKDPYSATEVKWQLEQTLGDEFVAYTWMEQNSTILNALGATNLQISGVFLSQSAIIGVLGVLAGYGLGILALTYRNGFLHFMNHLTGWELFPASIYGFSELPAIIDTRDIALICGSSFVICILGGVLPAWRAGRLKPVEALRYE